MSERLVAVDFAERTDPGRDPSKQVNEDSCGYKVTPLGHLAVVCDGMGGHEGGREASTRAVATIFATFERGSFEASQTPRGRAALLKKAVEEANAEVYALAPSAVHARPGSTCVALLLHPGGVEIAHVGDSRIYLVHGSQVTQLTRDHSVVGQLVAAGVLTPEQAEHHPDANQIVRALGMKKDVEVELAEHPLPYVAGDAFVLCSDGMSDLVKPEDLLQIVGSAPAAQIAGQLVDLANARGGFDNITVQVLRPRESSDQGITKPIAQTVVEPVGKTVVDVPAPAPSDPQRSTYVPPVPAASASGSSRSPSVIDDDEQPAHRSPAIVVGVMLAVLGLVIAGAAIFVVTSHKPKRVIDLDAEMMPTASASAAEPTMLSAPTSVPSAPVIDAGPLAPLLPGPGTRHRPSGSATTTSTASPAPTPTEVNL